MDCVKQVIFTNVDVWCLGVLCGGTFLVMFKWLEKYMETRFSVNQKRLDILLGEALIKMKIDLDNRITRIDKVKETKVSKEGEK